MTLEENKKVAESKLQLQKNNEFMTYDGSELLYSTLDNTSNPNKIGILSSGGLSNQILDNLKSNYSEFFPNATYELCLYTFNAPGSQFSGDELDEDGSAEYITEDFKPKLKKQTDLHSFTANPDIDQKTEVIRSTTKYEQTKEKSVEVNKPISFKERALQIFHDLKQRLGLGKKHDDKHNAYPLDPGVAGRIDKHAEIDRSVDDREFGPEQELKYGSEHEKELEREYENNDEIYKLREYAFDLIQDKDIVFIITYLDDPDDLENTFEILKIAKKFDIFSIVITSLPRFFGKVENVRSTNKTLQKLRLSAEMVLLLPFFDAMNFKLIPDLINELMEIIVLPGLINVDVADLKIIVKGGNVGVITFGTGRSSDRVNEALDAALSLKLLNVELGGVKKALLNVTGGPDMTLSEVEELAEQVKNRIQQGARIILGARIIQEQSNKIKLFLMLGVTPMQVMVNRYANE